MGREKLINFFYQTAILPITSHSPETTHDAVFRLLSCFERSDWFLKILRREFDTHNAEKLAVEAMGLKFPTPFSLAGGLIKYGEGACAMAMLGSGGLEAGTFTLHERRGNPRARKELLPDGRLINVKRIKRFADGTVINRMGFPNPGIEEGLRNLDRARQKAPIPIGINIGPNPDLTSYEDVMVDLKRNFEIVSQSQPPWITLNVSCPNIEEGQDRCARMEETLRLIKDCGQISGIPTLIKIGPDMNQEEIRSIVDEVKQGSYAGIIATNTTVDRTGPREKYAFIKQGGLSGPLLFERSLETVKLVREFDRQFGGEPLTIIGCGGIDSVGKWLQMKDAGANLCQIMTGFIFGGPYFFKRMNRDYLSYLS